MFRRIRLAAADVTRLVPEVAAPSWRRLLERHAEALHAADTPGAVHTALLSLAFNMGFGVRIWSRLDPLIEAREWLTLADAIEQLPMPAMAAAVRPRRREEAALIRAALAGALGGGES